MNIPINLICYGDERFWPLPIDRLGFIEIMGDALVIHIIKLLFYRDGFKSFRIISSHNEPIKLKLPIDIEYVNPSELDELDGIFIRGFDPFITDYITSTNSIMPDLANITLVDQHNIKRLWSKKSSKVIEITLPPLEYPWHFLDIMNFFLKLIHRFIHPDAEVADDAKIKGNVYIDKKAKILNDCTIVGPTYIGKNTIIGNNSLVRNSIISQNSIIGSRIEIARSLLLERSETHSGYIGDSIFSYKVHSGAEFVTANLRLDRKNILTKLGDNKVDTRRLKLGAIIGEFTEIGVNVSTMPGVLIGKNVKIGPNTVVFEAIHDNTIFYSQFNFKKK